MSNTVEIEFGKKDITNEEVISVIKDIAACKDGSDSCFNLEIIVNNDGYVTAIVVFKDVETAKNFVDAIESRKDDSVLSVKVIGFLKERSYNSASLISPLAFLFISL